IPLLGDAFRVLVSAARRLGVRVHPKLAGFMKYSGSFAGAYLLRRGVFMPWELGSVMDEGFMADGLRRLDPLGLIGDPLRPPPRTARGQVAVLESCLYLRNQLLRDTDWPSLPHALEVGVPLVDVRLLRELAPALASLPAGTGKRLLAASPGKPLPPAVLDRAKTGFETPIGDWLQRDDRLQTWRRVPQLT